jgi:hypothetical protein
MSFVNYVITTEYWLKVSQLKSQMSCTLQS